MANKLESTFKNMVLVLFTVTLIASTAVGFVNEFTKGPIENAKLNKKLQAIKDVVPAFDNDPSAEMYSVDMEDGGKIELYPAKKDGVLIATAVKTYTKKGFSGIFWLMVGLKPDGSIINYSVLEHKETPGLGSKMDVWFKGEGKQGIQDKNPATTKFSVSKDGGDIDAITAATISSRAFLNAVNNAYNAYMKDIK
jgi:electron transport complex protein RnfG